MNNFCDNCGEPINKTQKHCYNCGYVVNNRKNNTKRNIFIIAISIIIIISCLFVVGIYNNNKKCNQYMEDSELFLEKVNSISVLLENVGNDISTYWHDAIFDDKYEDINVAVTTAKNDNLDKILEIEKNKIEIDVLYIQLQKLPKSNDEFKEIKLAIVNYYDNYYDFYNLIINTTGNYNDFSTNFNNINNMVLKTYHKLKTIIEAYK